LIGSRTWQRTCTMPKLQPKRSREEDNEMRSVSHLSEAGEFFNYFIYFYMIIFILVCGCWVYVGAPWTSLFWNASPNCQEVFWEVSELFWEDILEPYSIWHTSKGGGPAMLRCHWKWLESSKVWFHWHFHIASINNVSHLEERVKVFVTTLQKPYARILVWQKG